MDTFVPNDVFLVGGVGIDSFPDVYGVDDDFMSEGSTPGNSVLICTGANACGKVRIDYVPWPEKYLNVMTQSVYLKQVSLFVPEKIMASICGFGV